MRIIVYSDTHGKFSAHAEILKRNEDADAFIFLGDGEREFEKMKKELIKDVTTYIYITRRR